MKKALLWTGGALLLFPVIYAAFTIVGKVLVSVVASNSEVTIDLVAIALLLTCVIGYLHYR
jgi:hypothetical protein